MSEYIALCPFCLQEPEVIEDDMGDMEDHFLEWEVVCNSDDCMNTRMVAAFGNTREEAIQNWNKRGDIPCVHSH